MAVNLSKNQEPANRNTTPWWPKCEPSDLIRQTAKERLAQYPIRSLTDVEKRLELYPDYHEIRSMMDGYFGAVSLGSNDKKSTGPKTLGYTLFVPEGKLHHKILSFVIPIDRWIFGDDGMWLNPLAPQLISLDDTETRQLFGLEKINYDIWTIPVHEDCYSGEGHEWLSSTCVVTNLKDECTNALFCIVRTTLKEAEELGRTVGGDLHGFFSYRDGEMATMTWLMDWGWPDCRGAGRSADWYELNRQKRFVQKERLYPNSYSAKYDQIIADWTERGEREDKIKARRAYLAQIPESRKLFDEAKIYKKADNAGYGFSMASEEAVLYREKNKTIPGQKPGRIRTFERRFPISPDGVIMVKNFLRLSRVIEEEFSDSNLLKMETKGLTFQFIEDELVIKDDEDSALA